MWYFQPDRRPVQFLGHEVRYTAASVLIDSTTVVLPSGVRCSFLSPMQGAVTCLHFSPQADRVASASKDRTVRLWHTTV